MTMTNYRERTMLLVEMCLDNMSKTDDDIKIIASRLLDWISKKGLDIYATDR